MKRIKILLFLSTLLIYFITPYYINKVSAAACTVSTNPSPPTTSDTAISLSIHAKGVLVEGNTYYLKLNDSSVFSVILNPFPFQLVNGDIIVSGLSKKGQIFPVAPLPILGNQFEEKTYIVSIFKDSDHEMKNPVCITIFTAVKPTTTTPCSISFLTKDFTPDEEISIKVDPLSTPPGLDEHRIILKQNGEKGDKIKDWHVPTTQLKNIGARLGKYEVGNYYVEIIDSYQSITPWLEKRECGREFTILSPGATGAGPGVSVGGPSGGTSSPVCRADTRAGKTFYICNTALGDINTDPIEFVKQLFAILLSLSGGIALLLIIVSGYHFLVSQGNPEKIQGARETLTSAIVGLLFIIFSMVILEVIGVDILAIPGLQR